MFILLSSQCERNIVSQECSYQEVLKTSRAVEAINREAELPFVAISR